MIPVGALVKSMRPAQWAKNGFVFAPVVFAQSLFHWPTLFMATAAFLAFCLVSSAVYLVNDIFDREADRQHPLKRHRPIASGALPLPMATTAVVILSTGAHAVAFVLSSSFGVVVLLYLVINLLYSAWLKHLPFLDVGAIAAGFLLRILGGAYAIDVPISRWLLICTFLIALFLGLGKRFHELNVAGTGSAAKQRRSLSLYRKDHLKLALWSTGSATTVSYVLYTLDPTTVDKFGTYGLAFTIPFVLFGIWRYLSLVGRTESAKSPTEEIVTDIPFMANMVGYGIVVLVILYLV